MCYQNSITNFITQDRGIGGSSLYYITTHWVIRCSGNNTNGRVPTTFIRRRSIKYIDQLGRKLNEPQLNTFPREGNHDGHNIVAILPNIHRNHPHGLWKSENGVDWQTAVDEIDAAIEYARRTGYERASREVRRGDFHGD